MDEEEEKFGLVGDEGDSDGESEDESEGTGTAFLTFNAASIVWLHYQTFLLELLPRKQMTTHLRITNEKNIVQY